jgi:hypothetical protein
MSEQASGEDETFQQQLQAIRQQLSAQVQSTTQQYDEALHTLAANVPLLRSAHHGQIRQLPVSTPYPFIAVDQFYDYLETANQTFLLIGAIVIQETKVLDLKFRTILLPPITDTHLLAGDLSTRLALSVLIDHLRTRPDPLYVFANSLSEVRRTLLRLLEKYATIDSVHAQRVKTTAGDLLTQDSIANDWHSLLTATRVVLCPRRIVTEEGIGTPLGSLIAVPLGDALVWSQLLQVGEYAEVELPMATDARVDALATLLATSSDDTTGADGTWVRAYLRVDAEHSTYCMETNRQSAEALSHHVATVTSAISRSDSTEPASLFQAEVFNLKVRHILPGFVESLYKEMAERQNEDVAGMMYGGWQYR